MAKRKQRKAATEQEVENHDEATVAAEAGPENDGHTAHAAEEAAAAEEGVEREGGGEGGAEGEEGPDAAARGGEEGKEEEEREVSFDELGLDEQLKRALRKKGLDKATPIQREAIPLILVRDFLHPCFVFFLLCFVELLEIFVVNIQLLVFQ
jgi:hypothetical protein